jgi:hypothetical protein
MDPLMQFATYIDNDFIDPMYQFLKENLEMVIGFGALMIFFQVLAYCAPTKPIIREIVEKEE